ncbi:putative ribonuclease H-like domain-containing protein [Tanacetum coccineum]
MPLSTYLNLDLGELAHTKLMVELVDRTLKYSKGIAENVLVGIGKFVFPVDFIILDMPKDVKVPLIPERPFLSTAYTKIDVFKRKITLRVGDDKIIFKSMKPASSLIKRVYMLGLRERVELELEARLIGETLVRDQVDDLMPTIQEGEWKIWMATEIKTWEMSLLENHSAKLHVCVARRFDGLITIYNGNDNMTYQMVRSHPRFKHLSNAQCNKIKPLLKCNVDLAAAAKNQFLELNELMELRDGAFENTRIYKERTKKWHDSRLRGDKDFKVRDNVLLFNSQLRMHPGKLKLKWYGPNVVKTVYPYGTVEITNKNGISFKVNGQRLKKYYDGHIDTEDKEVVEFDKDTT